MTDNETKDRRAGEADGREWFASLSSSDKWAIGDDLVLVGASDFVREASYDLGRRDTAAYRKGWRAGVARASDEWTMNQ